MSDPSPRPKPARITGLRHFFAAATYSIGGIKRLWQETAFRHIMLVFGLCLILLIGIGATAMEIAGFVILFLLLVAVEALNTAIECIVDHLAPTGRFLRATPRIWGRWPPCACSLRMAFICSR